MSIIDSAREVLQGLPEEERKSFITNFNKLDSDEKRQIAVERLTANFEGQQPAESAAKPTVRDLSRGMFGEGKVAQMTENAVADAIISPLTVVARGVYKGSEALYGRARGMTELAEAAIGQIESTVPESMHASIPMMQGIQMAKPALQQAGQMAGRAEEQMGEVARGLPDSGMGKGIDTVYELIGGAVPTLVGFAATKAGLAKAGISLGVDQLDSVAQFAVLSAAQEYSQDPTNEAALRGAGEGAAISMSFGIASKGLNLLKNAGKSAAKSFVHAFTKDTKLAKDFVDNPDKYNLNPFTGKAKSAAEIRDENLIQKEHLKNENKRLQEAFKARRDAETHALNTKLKDIIAQKKEVYTETKNSLKETNTTKLEDLRTRVIESIKNGKNVMSQKAVKLYDDVLGKYELLRKELGENVEQAIRHTLEQNPGAGIDSKYVKGKFDSVVKKHAPFKISDKTGKVTSDKEGLMELAIKSGQYQPPVVGQSVAPITAAGKQTDAKQFELILNQMNKLSKEKTLPLQYLQQLKNDLRTLSKKAFEAKDDKLRILYTELSKVVDPAKAVADSPQIAAGLKDIAAANKQFAAFKPKYDEAMRLHFTKDSQGGFVPNIDKAIVAIKGGNKALLRQMRIADTGLAPEDRMVPKLQEFVRQQEMLETQQRDMITALKKKTEQDLKKHMIAGQRALNNLRREQGNLSFQNKQKLISETSDYVKKTNADYQGAVKELDRVEEFYTQQETMRSYRPTGESALRIFQNLALGTSGLASAFGQGPVKVGALAAGAAVAPIIGGNAIQAAAKLGTPTYHMLKELLDSPTAQQIIGGRIIDLIK
jgi:hypothetical protein